MVLGSQNLIVTSTGLSRASMELISERIYDPSKVSVVGSPIITSGGSASSFGAESYVIGSDISLGSIGSVKIKCIGYFVPKSNPNDFQCLWSLIDTINPSNSLSLCVNSNKLIVFKGFYQLFNVLNIDLENRDYLDITVTLRENSYNIVLMHNSGVKTFDGTFQDTLVFDNYTSVNIGWTFVNPSYYWYDRINLQEFLVYSDSTIIYSLSEETYFNFTKILVGDGTIPLTDTSVPVLNHVYSFGISEIKRTGNVITLKSEIDETSYLINISELALFIKTEEGKETIFAKVENLAINKTSELDYTLIFKIDLSLSVVNTIALPEIVVRDSDIVSLSDIYNAEKVYTNVVTDMERAIANNATLIGYNEVMAANDVLKNINACQGNFSAARAYINIRNDISSANVADFYSFSDFPFVYSTFYSKNLSGTPYSTIRVTEGMVTGQRDNIDFSNPLGFSLCIGVTMNDVSNKLIVAKINESEDAYFSLEVKDFSVIFKLTLMDSSVYISKIFDVSELQDISIYKYLITITCDNSGNTPVLSMYCGDTLVSQVQASSKNYITDTGYYRLTNYSSDFPTPSKNYMDNIISFQGVLTLSDIRLIQAIISANNF